MGFYYGDTSNIQHTDHTLNPLKALWKIGWRKPTGRRGSTGVDFPLLSVKASGGSIALF